jgi:aminopeptidase N
VTARTRVVPALLTLALTGSVLTDTTATAAHEERGPRTGATGIGDPYFPRDGNGGIDVLHYDIHDSYSFGSGRLTGTTKLDLRATQDLSRFDLDFLLPVSSVTVDGRRAGFLQSGDHELRIDPATALATGAQVRVAVRYAGVPASESSGGESNWLADGDEVVAMNEPHMATWWFPANDHPLDKASYDVRITVPKGKDVVSNGVLVDRRKHRGRATTHWRSEEPMASYLAFFAAGSFETRSGTYNGRPYYVAVSNGVSQPLHDDVMGLMLRSGEITAWLESVVGPYPFSTTGGLVTSLPVTFALENQTRPTYPAVGSGNVGLVVHELAHQWFGDSVSVRGWRDVWLNEGFAQFLQQYYPEAQGQRSTQTWLTETYDRYLASPEFWRLRVDDPGHGHLFDTPIYDRGAMAVQALRHRVGDPAFWLLLRTWVDQRRYGNGSVPEFEALATSVSGQDLTSFFDAWLHQETAPARTAANGLV